MIPSLRRGAHGPCIKGDLRRGPIPGPGERGSSGAAPAVRGHQCSRSSGAAPGEAKQMASGARMLPTPSPPDADSVPPPPTQTGETNDRRIGDLLTVKRIRHRVPRGAVRWTVAQLQEYCNDLGQCSYWARRRATRAVALSSLHFQL